MSEKTAVTVAYGDGIGPEIMAPVLEIMEAAGAALDIETITIGEKMFEKGVMNGIDEAAWESLYRTGVFLKAPITTPQGGGFKSLNVTVRKIMGMFANVRPCVSYHPYVQTTQPNMDMVIVRENEEDLYAGVEYQPTENVVQSLKLISQTGSERIIRYAFEYARTAGRKKVSCISKDNIMKMADGLFHDTFKRIAKEYPDIENNHWIVDIGAARVASKPELFDVIVTENLYGDIISDIAAEVSGSVGLGGSSNIGLHGAMFEAIHGSAPDIAGQGIANPSGLLHGAILMLQHIGQADPAEKIHNAWLKTLEDGIHTGDIYNDKTSTQKVGTSDFAKAIIERLGSKPEKFSPISYGGADGRACQIDLKSISLPPESPLRKLVGVDIFLRWRESNDANQLGDALKDTVAQDMILETIATKGLMVWPNAVNAIMDSDFWCCRFKAAPGVDMNAAHITAQLNKLAEQGFEFVKTENLYETEGNRAYSLAQGQ